MTSRGGQRLQRNGTIRLWWLILLVVVAGLVWLVASLLWPDGTKEHAPYALAAALFGSAVGASELVSRYRDEPMHAVASRPGALYLGLNALISAATYGLLSAYASSILPALKDDPLMTSVVAGFGGMLILRSKFFTLRSEAGEDFSVGPDAVITTFLSAADRAVDRSRAERRMDVVDQEVGRFDPMDDGIRDRLAVSLAAFQNLSNDEKEFLEQEISAVYESGYPAELKLRSVSYGLLGIAGERTFRRMMKTIRRGRTPGSTDDQSA